MKVLLLEQSLCQDQGDFVTDTFLVGDKVTENVERVWISEYANYIRNNGDPITYVKWLEDVKGLIRIDFVEFDNF